MSKPKPTISINVDPTNPGQFFACCGLLELASRIWPGAEGWFSATGGQFNIRRADLETIEQSELFTGLLSCDIFSTMTDAEISRLKTLQNKKKSDITTDDEREKVCLSKNRERERIILGSPFDLGIDWWSDDLAGGSRFKTWAGKQFIIDLVRGMRSSISESWSEQGSEKWLSHFTNNGSLPMYFDSDIGGCSSSIDVGFSLDSLDLRSHTRPMIEMAAFAGLQRFRPDSDTRGGPFTYATWHDPLSVILASAICSGAIERSNIKRYSFSLLYRTKYLKSFLPSKHLP